MHGATLEQMQEPLNGEIENSAGDSGKLERLVMSKTSSLEVGCSKE